MSIVIKTEGELAVSDCELSGSEETTNFELTREDGGGGGGGDNYNSNSSSTSSATMETEKRMRREIANSNERRRMQSINAGFQSLKNLLPHHEGEKLSKAAILQQTAEYVCVLERERTQLLSQNCQLKRQLDSSDSIPNGAGVNVPEAQSAKKRKFDNVMTMQTISDSSDEGLGSMSPEPVTIFTVVTKHPSGGTSNQTAITIKEFMDLKHQLEMERRSRVHLEEQIRHLQCDSVYAERVPEGATIQYQEVIEHTDNLRDDNLIIKEYTKVPMSEIREIHHHHDEVQILSVESLPPIAHTQVVECSPGMDEDDERTMTPDELPKDDEPIIETKVRLQPILEAAIKAEPKVEVERINSPASITAVVAAAANNDEDTVAVPVVAGYGNSQARMLLTSTSRQNLETIVEAIRHLEGDSLFNDEITEQDVPLALTTTKPAQRQLQVEMNSFLQFRTTGGATSSNPANSNSLSSLSSSAGSLSSSVPTAAASISHQIITSSNVITAAHQKPLQTSSVALTTLQQQQQQQQCRPGVIVGKQNS